MPGYDPDQDLAGAVYLFLRGMIGPGTPAVDGVPCGVFGWRPPSGLVADLSDALDASRRLAGACRREAVMSVIAAERDPLEPRLALHASGLLREFNAAGVLAAADVHVARRLQAIADDEDESVALAVALAVRAPRLGHVHVDLARIRDTAAVEAEEPVDLAALHWPDPEPWIARVARSPLVARATKPAATARCD